MMTPTTSQPNSRIRNRVVETRLVRAGDLLDHEGNPFIHPLFQRQAVEGTLEEIGIVDVLKVYPSARNGGALTLLDGHLRKHIDPDLVWPVAVLDLTDEEADAQLMLHNVTGQWAEVNPLAMQALIDRARSENEKTEAARERLKEQIAEQVAIAKRALGHADAPPRESNSYDTLKLAPMVKAAFPVGDDLDTVERAIRATGIVNRGAALGYICNYFIRMHGETKNTDEQEGPKTR